MNSKIWNETMVEREVTYTLEIDGKFFIVEHVPARICVETGEQFFAPETLESLQHIIGEQKTPSRVIVTPVFEFHA